MSCLSCKQTNPGIHDYYSENIYTWCTNCGNYGIHAAVKRALVLEKVQPKDSLLCFDIGCNGNGSDKIEGYRYHGLHGRIIPFACGAALANSKVTVLAFAGDGATLGEGVNHLVHAVRTNYNITFILHNNLNYGLTQGQASATTKKHMKMNSSPDGLTAEPIHPQRFVLSLGATFTARVFSGDVQHMTKVVQAGLQHQGFSFIEVLQSCPTYNKETPHEWYQQHSIKLEENSHDRTNRAEALKIAEPIEDNIALGVIYQDPNSLPFHKAQPNRLEVNTELVDEVEPFDVTKLLEKFR